jgi:enterochelin esterase family protein
MARLPNTDVWFTTYRLRGDARFTYKFLINGPPIPPTKVDSNTDPSRIIVAGSSLGGLAATYAGFRHPEVFGNVLSQSGSFWWKPEGDNRGEWLTHQFKASPKLHVRFYLDVGLMEGGSASDAHDMVIVNRRMRDVLRAKGYQLYYQEFNDGHEYVNWRGTFADGILFLAGKDRGEKDGKMN